MYTGNIVITLFFFRQVELIAQFLTVEMNSMHLGITFSENARTATIDRDSMAPVDNQQPVGDAQQDQQVETQFDDEDDPLRFLEEYVLVFLLVRDLPILSGRRR